MVTLADGRPARVESGQVPSSVAARQAVVAVGLVAIAAIHLADLPGKLDEVPYLGWMYLGLIAACVVLAELVVARPHPLVCAAAAALAAGTILAFVLTRTTGLPSASDDVGNWSEPLGLVSLLTEAVTVWWAMRSALTARPLGTEPR